MHWDFVVSCAGKEFPRTRPAKPARPDGAQGAFGLPRDADFFPAAQCGRNSGGIWRRRTGPRCVRPFVSAEKRLLKMPLIGGERVGGLREYLLEVFERLEERVSLIARPDPMAAA